MSNLSALKTPSTSLIGGFCQPEKSEKIRDLRCTRPNVICIQND